MEYFIGALATLLCAAVIYPVLNFNHQKVKNISLHYRQSYNFEIVSPWAWISRPRKELDTQSTRYAEEHSTRVVLSNDKAYWIINNQLLEADIIDGKVDGNTTKRVDTMALNDVELNNLSFIVEKLTEGKTNEGVDPRDKDL
jgi:hypothetical protein